MRETGTMNAHSLRDPAVDRAYGMQADAAVAALTAVIEKALAMADASGFSLVSIHLLSALERLEDIPLSPP